MLQIFDELRLTEGKSQLWYSVAEALLTQAGVARTPFQCKYRIEELNNKGILEWNFEEVGTIVYINSYKILLMCITD